MSNRKPTAKQSFEKNMQGMVSFKNWLERLLVEQNLMKFFMLTLFKEGKSVFLRVDLKGYIGGAIKVPCVYSYNRDKQYVYSGPTADEVVEKCKNLMKEADLLLEINQMPVMIDSCTPSPQKS